jgi:uncharacterized protein (TIGR00251 family)
VRIPLTAGPAGISLAVRVIPRGGRTAIAGIRGEALLVRLAAAPVDGAANDALIALLSETLDCPRRDVSLVSGHQSQSKRVTIRGLNEAQVAARLDAILTQ